MHIGIDQSNKCRININNNRLILELIIKKKRKNEKCVGKLNAGAATAATAATAAAIVVAKATNG